MKKHQLNKIIETSFFQNLSTEDKKMVLDMEDYVVDEFIKDNSRIFVLYRHLKNKYGDDANKFEKKFKMSVIKIKIKYLLNDKELLNSGYYEFVVRTVKSLEDISLIEPFCRIARNNNLLASRHFKYAMNTIKRVKDKYDMECLGELLCNSELLNSDYYRFAIENFKKMNCHLEEKFLKKRPYFESERNFEAYDFYINSFRKFFSNEDLLNSKYYKFAVNMVMNHKDLNMNRIFNVLISPPLLNSEHYEFVLTTIVDMKTINAHFCNVVMKKEIIESSYFKFIVNEIKNLDDPDFLNQIRLEMKSKHLLNSPYFKIFFNVVQKIENLNHRSLIIELLSDEKLLNSRHYKFILRTIENTDLDIIIYQLMILILDERLLNSKYYELMLNTAIIVVSNLQHHELDEPFRQILVSEKLLNSEYYEFAMSTIIEIAKQGYTKFENSASLMKFMDNENLINSNWYEFTISTLKNIKNKKVLDSIVSLLEDGKMLALLNYCDLLIELIEELSINRPMVSGLKTSPEPLENVLDWANFGNIINEFDDDTDINSKTLIYKNK